MNGKTVTLLPGKPLTSVAPGRFAPKPVPPGTIPPEHVAQNFERDCSLQSSGTIRSKTNLRVDSPIFIIYMYIFIKN